MYSQKKKEQIAKEAVSKPRNISATAKRYGVTHVTVAAWIKRYAGNTTTTTEADTSLTPAQTRLSAVRAEVRNLVFKEASRIVQRDYPALTSFLSE